MSAVASDSVFGSARERRLWMWVGVVVLGIYSTLGLARTLADTLRAEGLLSATFMLGFLLIIATVIVLAVRARPGVLEIGIGMGVAAVYLLVLTRMAIPTERSHLIEYSVVAVLIYEALRERASSGKRVRKPALAAIVLASLIGLVDELIQLVIPSRVFDPIDVAFNTLAALMAIAGTVALRWARDRSQLSS